MTTLAAALRRLFRRAADEELDEELRFHLEMQAAENRRRGMSAADAERAATDSFGGYERIKEACRDARGGRFFEMLAQDVRFAARTLRANPGFSAAVILTLGLGIGANTAIFSTVHSVLLRPLPYEQGDRLVRIFQRARAGDDLGFSPLELADFRARTRSFTALVEYHSMSFHLLGGAEPQRVQTGVVSAAFFDVMGLRPLYGRTFLPGEDAAEAEPVLVLSHAFWQRAFDGDRHVVGRTVEMNDRRHRIVGVLPPAPLSYPNKDDVYMPVSACPFRSGHGWSHDRQARGLTVFARLRDGTSIDAAHADLEAAAATMREPRLEGTGAAAAAATWLETVPLRDELTRAARPTFLMLAGTAALVLLIACANVANLMLAALLRRDRELALRTALGAGRARLLRQLLTESTLLSLLGGLAGLALASLGLDLLVAFAARFTPRAQEIAIDGTVLAFTAGLSMATGLIVGAVAACTRQDVVTALKEGGDRATGGPAGRRARLALTMSQVAISFMLLIGAGLMLRSLMRLHDVDPGFAADDVVTARLDLNWSKYHDGHRVLAFSDDLLGRLRALPGVRHAAVANSFPLSAVRQRASQFEIRGRPASTAPPPRAEVRSASAEYFAAVGMRVVRGRLYRDDDVTPDGHVAVINEALARRYWGSGDAVGQQVSGNGGRTWVTIVGIVSDVRHDGLDREPAPEAYVPWDAQPWRDMRLVVRAGGDVAAVVSALPEIVRQIDPEQPITEIQTLQAFRREALAPPTLTAMLLATFAALALGITLTGLAGVMAFSVSQRTQEFGVRMILGADRGQVLRMVLREGIVVVAAGLGLGVAGAMVFTSLLSGLLFEVEPRDPLTFLSVSVVLLAVAAAACLVPARRATLVQPVAALRSL